MFQPTPMCMKRYNRSERLKGNYTTLVCSNPVASGGECVGPHSWQAIYDNDSQMLDAVAARLEEREREVEREDNRIVGVALTDAKVGELLDVAVTGIARANAMEETVHDLVDGIEAGEYDAYLEVILSAAHERKRAKRGVRGLHRWPEQLP